MRVLRLALAVIVLSMSSEALSADAPQGSPNGAVPLVAVDDPPPVQMLVPGFTVRELPVTLTNVNNLRYRPDGKLYALGYNGDIWLLSDADADGLEETSTTFFHSQGSLRGPIGMAVIPRGHALLTNASAEADGVVVASKGKVSAILDLNGDDVADEERVIATGWKEIPQNVDAIGIAIHPDDGSIYFGLGTAAYNNAYLLDEAGRSGFDLNSERGTIQRIAPDLSGRSTVCTGVRFSIGMEFNEHGELFVTDQEGATWLPNGNPFDELLHIRSQRHYGFPPRHPQHLPHVFDEPSLFDYGPQHQSTCGFAFNLPQKPNGSIFGPAAWRGDALVTGESRGKLYRTRLVKDASGEYVADNQIIACLSMLTVDCCLTPSGELLVACHSGGPDWGTGPSGKGRIFQIRYEPDEEPALPTTVWVEGAQEVRVAFSRPLDPAELKDLAAKTCITYGNYVAAGDEFETIRPGYAVTKFQQSAPRYPLAVLSASVTPDRRTLILATAPHPAAVSYALTLPGLGRPDLGAQNEGSVLPQHPRIDLAYSLNGVEARWKAKAQDQADGVWSGWLPHLDLAVALKLHADEALHQELQSRLERPGTLTLRTQLDLRGLFAPAVQPTSTLDFPPHEDRFVEQREVRLHADRPFTWAGADGMMHAASQAENGWYAAITVDPERLAPVPLSLQFQTGTDHARIRPEWHVRLADGRVRSGPLALHRFLLPWAALELATPEAAERQPIPELAGANWGRGRRIFLGEKAGCGLCHVAQGDGGLVGPDLSNLIHRDYASVLRDVTQPSFAINPDFITYTATLDDGRVLTGTVRTAGDQLLVGDKEGRVTRVARDAIEMLQPSPVSTMPDGIAAKLDSDEVRDLMAFLLQPAPSMPQDAKLPAPPPRGRAEVAAVLAGSDPRFAPGAEGRGAESLRPLNILLVAGKKDHGPGEHDYPAWLDRWSQLVAAAEEVTVDTAMEWPTAEQLQAADTIVFFQKGSWSPERAEAIDAHLADGGGLVYIHWAVEGGPAAPEFAKRIGLASQAAKIKYRHGPLDLGFATGSNHPIGRNFDQVHLYDESYWQLVGDRKRINVIATAVEEEEPRPLFWTLEPSAGRVFVSIPGHYSWTFDDPLFRILLLRGIAWSAGEPVDRLNELILLGASVED